MSLKFNSKNITDRLLDMLHNQNKSYDDMLYIQHTVRDMWQDGYDLDAELLEAAEIPERLATPTGYKQHLASLAAIIIEQARSNIEAVNRDYKDDYEYTEADCARLQEYVTEALEASAVHD